MFQPPTTTRIKVAESDILDLVRAVRRGSKDKALETLQVIADRSDSASFVEWFAKGRAANVGATPVVGVLA